MFLLEFLELRVLEVGVEFDLVDCGFYFGGFEDGG